MSGPAMPSINAELCVNCGACVRTCRFGVFTEGDECARVDGQATCLACGQCIAVCPVDAITHPELPAEGFVELSPEIPVTPDALMDLLARRRSVKNFEDREVPAEVIARLMDAAVLAPSGHNSQSWAFTVITDRERLAEVSSALVASYSFLLKMLGNPLGRLMLRLVAGSAALRLLVKMQPAIRRIVDGHAWGEDWILGNAPALVLAHAPKSDAVGDASCRYAMGNMAAMAVAEGLGTCLLGLVTAPAQRDRKIARLLGVPDDHELHEAAVLGYPASNFRKSVPKHKPSVTTI